MRLVEADGVTPLWLEPRAVLESVITRFHDLSLHPVVAVELEFYVLDAERDDNGAPQRPLSLVTGRRETAGKVYGMAPLEEYGGVLSAIQNACRSQGLPLAAISREYGASQYEINLDHVDNPLAAADQCALMRRAVVATARAEGYDASFMSKPFRDDSGSGFQVKLDILDEAGANIFDPRRADGGLKLGQAVAGMQAMTRESMLLFAPNLSAFRRFDVNQFTPVTLDWGENNRAVAFRAPMADPANRRVEHRVAGADANPYLVMAGVLAAAHYGLSPALTPTPKAEGNVGETADPNLPRTFWSAMARLRAGGVIRDYFSARYVEAYADVKQCEFDAFFHAMLPREHEWYL